MSSIWIVESQRPTSPVPARAAWPRSARRASWSPLVVAVCVGALAGWPWRATAPAAETDDELKARVLSLWEQRRNAFATARYEAEGTTTVAKGAHSGLPGSPPGAVSPPTDTTHEVKCAWLIDFKRSLIRIERQHFGWSPVAQQNLPSDEVLVFDGKRVKELERAGSTDSRANSPQFVVRERPEGKAALRNSQDLPVFFSHGILDTRLIEPTGLNPDSFRIVGTRLSADGNTCDQVILEKSEPPSFGNKATAWRYTADLTKGGAIVAAQKLAGDVPTTDLAADYELRSGHWLPVEWSLTVYRNEAVFCSLHHRVIDIVLDLPVRDSDFQLEPRPNSVVVNGDTGDFFRVGPDGKSLTKIDLSAGRPSTLSHPGAVWVFALTGGILLLLVLACTLRRKKGVAKRSD